MRPDDASEPAVHVPGSPSTAFATLSPETIDAAPVEKLPALLAQLGAVQSEIAAHQARIAARLASASVRDRPTERPPPRPRLLTVKDIATALQVSPRWVYANQHALGGVSLGRFVRFPQEALDTALEKLGR